MGENMAIIPPFMSHDFEPFVPIYTVRIDDPEFPDLLVNQSKTVKWFKNIKDHHNLEIPGLPEDFPIIEESTVENKYTDSDTDTDTNADIYKHLKHSYLSISNNSFVYTKMEFDRSFKLTDNDINFIFTRENQKYNGLKCQFQTARPKILSICQDVDSTYGSPTNNILFLNKDNVCQKVFTKKSIPGNFNELGVNKLLSENQYSKKFITSNRNVFYAVLVCKDLQNDIYKPYGIVRFAQVYDKIVRQICPINYMDESETKNVYVEYQPQFNPIEISNAKMINTNIKCNNGNYIPVNLYDHQKYNISKVIGIENSNKIKVRVCDLPSYNTCHLIRGGDPSDPKSYYRNMYGSYKQLGDFTEQSVYGGIINDKVGMGKTLTSLSIVLENILRLSESKYNEDEVPIIPIEEPEPELSLLDIDNHLNVDTKFERCHTTLVVAPKHVINQWFKETGRITWPEWFKIAKVSTITHLRKVIKDRFNYHLVIVNWQVFTSSRWTTLTETCDNIKYFQINRLIVDEIHELLNQNDIYSEIHKIKSKHKWGITATIPSDFEGAIRMTNFLIGKDLPDTHVPMIPDIANIPVFRSADTPQHFEVHNVTELLEPNFYEQNLIQNAQDEKEMLRICCAPDKIYGEEDMETSEIMTVGQLMREYVDKYTNELNNILARKASMIRRQTDFRAYVRYLEYNRLSATQKAKREKPETYEADRTIAMSFIESRPEGDPPETVSTLRQKIRNIDTRIDKLMEKVKPCEYLIKQYSSVAQEAENTEETECPICFVPLQRASREIEQDPQLEQLNQEPGQDSDSELETCRPSIFTKCGHVFCHSCVSAIYQDNPNNLSCPMCRTPHGKNDIKMVVDGDILPKLGDSSIDALSSKFKYIIRDIKETLRNIDSGAKFIVFSRNENMLNRIASTLSMGDVQSIKLCGSSTRQRLQIQEFETSGTCNVILLSLERFCSGLDLSCANYIYLIDSMLDPDFRPPEVEIMEQQASGRVMRLGQKSNHVYIKRLILGGTGSPDSKRYREYLDYLGADNQVNND